MFFINKSFMEKKPIRAKAIITSKQFYYICFFTSKYIRFRQIPQVLSILRTISLATEIKQRQMLAMHAAQEKVLNVFFIRLHFRCEFYALKANTTCYLTLACSDLHLLRLWRLPRFICATVIW